MCLVRAHTSLGPLSVTPRTQQEPSAGFCKSTRSPSQPHKGSLHSPLLLPPTASRGNRALGLPAEKTEEASRCHTWDNELYISRMSELVPVQTTSNRKARGDPLRSKSRQEQSKRMQAPLEMQGAVPLFHHSSDGSEGAAYLWGGVSNHSVPLHRLPPGCKQGLTSSHPYLPTHLTLLRFCLYPPAHLKKINCI